MNTGEGVLSKMQSGDGDRDESVETPDELDDDAEQDDVVVKAEDGIDLAAAVVVVVSMVGDTSTLLKTDEIEGRLYGENR